MQQFIGKSYMFEGLSLTWKNEKKSEDLGNLTANWVITMMSGKREGNLCVDVTS